MRKPDNRHGSQYYQIKVKGRLDKKWIDWFGNMTVTYKGEETILTGQIADQAALHGLLVRIRDLNLSLLSVDRIKSSGKKDEE